MPADVRLAHAARQEGEAWTAQSDPQAAPWRRFARRWRQVLALLRHPFGNGRLALAVIHGIGGLSLFICRYRRFAGRADAHERRTDSDHVAHLGAEPQDFAVDRRRNLDRGLVGHDRRDNVVLAHRIADLDMPFDEFGLGNALADVRKLDGMLAHHTASIASRRACATRAGPGK
jgi:hypothetical protein